jgi:hypothetical protein
MNFKNRKRKILICKKKSPSPVFYHPANKTFHFKKLNYPSKTKPSQTYQ